MDIKTLVSGTYGDLPLGGFQLADGSERAASYVILVNPTGTPYTASGGGGGSFTGTYEASPPTLSNNATTPILVDSKGNQYVNINAGAGSAAATPSYGRLIDGLTANAATVAAFHSADNQNPGTTGFGLLTGGVAQLLNPVGNLDRQRGTAVDDIPAFGIATGTAQLASPISITSSTAISAGAASATITLSAASGSNRGAPWKIQVGSYLTIDAAGANPEPALVTAIAGTSATIVFSGTGGISKYAHSGTYSITTFVYNQARDASAPDGSTGAGFAAGATYLLNTSLNSGAGGWEGERSANGELDGATGAGSAIAVGYEYNSGGPSANGQAYDRERNLQGKARTTGVVSSGGTQGSTSVTLSAAPTGLQPGSPVLFSTGSFPGAGTYEVAYTSPSYVAGANPVVLASALVLANTYTAVAYDAYASNGPGLAGITPFGIGIEEDVVYDPVSGLLYIERSATQDGVSGQNLPMESLGLYNGATFDRLRSTAGAASPTATGVLAVGQIGAPTGSGNFTPGQVTVGTSATQIAAARTGVPGTGRVSITVVNNSTTAVVLGGSGVTATTGVILPGTVGASITLPITAAVYGIVASGTAAVSFYEIY